MYKLSMGSINHPIIMQCRLENLSRISHALITYSGMQRVWFFSGEMGVGKTTLIRSVCAQLQIEDRVTSPTFSIVNEYRCITNEKIYHFDFFRMKEQRDVKYIMEHIDFERYIESGAYCFIEWPLQFFKLLLSSYFHITMTYCKEDSRNIHGILQ